jgi:hypothetical protein
LIQFDQAKEFLFKEEPETFFFFDVADYARYGVRVASSTIKPFISKYLFNIEKSGTEGICAISGELAFLQDDIFPQEPTLAKLGPTKIFSMNKDANCHYRYGRISTEIIPVSKTVANYVQGALEWITDPDREKKTWTMVSSGQFEIRNGKKTFKDDLLIVYLEQKPDLEANSAHMLGGMTRQAFGEATFEAVSKKVVEALQEAQDVKVNDRVEMFVLRKADKERRQVAMHRNFTVSQVITSAKAWRTSAKNTPSVSIPITSEKEGKDIWLSPWCPFPANLVRLTQKQWQRYGKDSAKVIGVSLAQVYDVFFDWENKEKNTTQILLGLTLRRTEPLLIGLGEAIHKVRDGELKEMKRDFTPEARFSALMAVSALSIYLYKLGITKERYMKSDMFYLGRLLSLVDTLHFEYCKYVRGGYPKEGWRKAIPPQLLGNAHLNIASNNPESALARLLERIAPYQAWAMKEPPQEGNWAHWAIAEIGKITPAIAENSLPSMTTDADKAEILLGYLSRSEKKSQEGSESSDEENS